MPCFFCNRVYVCLWIIYCMWGRNCKGWAIWKCVGWK